MMSDRISALRRTALFGSLGDEELRALAAPSVERKLAREETLFVAGEEARWLYVIVKGSVRAFHSGPEGREQVIHTECPGATLAEVGRVLRDDRKPSGIAARKLVLQAVVAAVQRADGAALKQAFERRDSSFEFAAPEQV